MKFSFSLVALALGGTALALPTAELEARQNSGSYTIAGLGARKKQITAAGANTFDLAIAMLESEHMTADYAYGDNKQQDSANFGIFKQNWGLLRECCPRFKGQPQSNWNNGAVLNSNLNADVQCLTEPECQNYYGLDRHPELPQRVNYIQTQLTTRPNGLTNDVRYWVYVVPI
ncbi:hypothetical protein INS49_006221 [Diaporthe citri]|uniref:uncharacterized protein n=1 Tax=Diaporthe citri TaxID=83186 RepID=UPI001C7ED8DE|nr:uncharacterized protein INS49_006221 [Diaporthe citri]KAG6364618.1 hypothetical protein INS49_006221 [Diaporthe citri]